MKESGGFFVAFQLGNKTGLIGPLSWGAITFTFGGILLARSSRNRKRNQKRAIIAGVSVAAVVVVGGAAFAIADSMRERYTVPVSDKVQDYYDQHTTLGPPSASAAALKPLTVTRPDSRPLTVLFAGDSLTVGRDASSEATAFRSLIAAHLKAGGPVDAKRIGNSSRTVSDVLPEAQHLTKAYDVLVVELGTNDVYKNDPAGFTKDYPAFLDAVRKTSPNGSLVCAGAWQSNALSAQLDNTISRECEARGGRFANLRDIYSTPGNLSVAGQPSWDSGTTDGKHPSDKGHRAIADRVLSMLTVP